MNNSHPSPPDNPACCACRAGSAGPHRQICPTPTPLALRLLPRHQFVIHALTGKPAPLINWLLTLAPVRSVLAQQLGIPRTLPLPPLTRQRFTRWVRARQDKSVPERTHYKVHARTAQAVYLFFGCAVQYSDLAVGVAAMQLLEAGGWNPLTVRHACCGAIRACYGDPAGAQAMARHTLHRLGWYTRRGIPVVGVSAGCVQQLRHAVQTYALLNNSDTRHVLSQTDDLLTFLARHAHRLPLRRPEPPLRVYLADAASALTLAPLLHQYAGVVCVAAAPYDRVVHPDLLWRMQLRRSTGVICQHPLELLAELL